MIIQRRSILTSKEHSLDIPVTPDQLARWENGMLIQHAMPLLTSDQREFIINGITVEEWDEVFGGEEYEGKTSTL